MKYFIPRINLHLKDTCLTWLTIEIFCFLNFNKMGMKELNGDMRYTQIKSNYVAIDFINTSFVM